jgi:hypothetical protein
MTAIGTACGFEVSSSLPFSTLRPGSGGPLRVILGEGVESEGGQLLGEWNLLPGQSPIRLRAQGDDFVVSSGALGIFTVRPGMATIEVPSSGHPLAREAFLWATPTSVLVTLAGDLLLHAAAVEVSGRALLLTGSGRAGKTTMAAALHNAGHRLLSDDAIRISFESGQPQALPGPALLRLRHDVAGQLPVKEMQALMSTTEKVFLCPEPDRRGTGDPIPVAAVVSLDWAEDVRMTPSPLEESLALLWPRAFYLPSEESRSSVFHGLMNLLEGVPTYRLLRPPDFAQLERVISQLTAGSPV